MDPTAREPPHDLEAERLEQLPRNLFIFCCQFRDDWEQLAIDFSKGCWVLTSSPLRHCSICSDHEKHHSVEEFASGNSHFFIYCVLCELNDLGQAGIKININLLRVKWNCES